MPGPTLPPAPSGDVAERHVKDRVGLCGFRHLRASGVPSQELASAAPRSQQRYLLQISSPKPSLPACFSADSRLLFPAPISDFLCCPHTTPPQGPAPLQVPLTPPLPRDGLVPQRLG